ncbi:FAD-dependent thymidylate synthase [uncultured Caudovirales phage]|uniref:FAD-dependent thymidylate synthase n=1 Tax=uncultured Caudovirales phage TaxID=2100421 RepID=A0A6J5L9F5_9CAUD|nr:FAD-dependent thymidylate synthase [uncultured Caudovirales phage]
MGMMIVGDYLDDEAITANIIADSINEMGQRMTTMELEYPRFILAELNTHRMLSKNSASSRAIPVKRMIELIDKNPAMPVHWGQNQAGMSAKTELPDLQLQAAKKTWMAAKDMALAFVRVLNDIGLHKQVANRIAEPWQRMKTVISGTEWENLLWLRDHEDAQPEFAELARCIRIAMEQSKPMLLAKGEWHLPYVKSERINGWMRYYDSNGEELSLTEAIKISTSCCAQVSYRRLDESREKALDIYDKLIGADRKHFSPFEHQAMPIPPGQLTAGIQHIAGVSHMDKKGDYWSGNLRGWVQHRKILEEQHEV